MKYITLSRKLLFRDLKSGELYLIIAAVTLSVLLTSTLNFFTNRIARTVSERATQLLGADLIINSDTPIPEAWISQAHQTQLKTAKIIYFPSVIVHGEHLQLVSVKAVSQYYPLRGEVKIANSPYGKEYITHDIPQPGHVWLEPRAFNSLHVKIGDKVEVGSAKFIVSRAITFEPDRTSIWFSISPRLMMNIKDIPKTEVIQPGSRISYRLLLAGNENQLTQYRQWLKNKISPEQQIRDVKNAAPAINIALTRSERYFNLGSILALILAGIAIAIAARKYSERHSQYCALLKSFGAKQNHITVIYSLNLFYIGLISGALGLLGGIGLQYLLDQLFLQFINIILPPIHLLPGFFAIIIGFILLFGFAAPPLLVLRHVPVASILRKNKSAIPPIPLWQDLLAPIVIFLLVYWYSQDWLLTLIIFTGIILVILMIFIASAYLVKFANIFRRRLQSQINYGIANITRHYQSSLTLLIAFGLTIMVLLLATIVKTDLLSAWFNQIPPKAPNYFAINISPQQKSEFRQYLIKHQVTPRRIYPVIRGRLIALNGKSIRQAVPVNARHDNVLNRAINLTYMSEFPPDNTLVAGKWWHSSDNGLAKVSLSSRLANRLNIKLNDTISLMIASETIKAQVVSLRKIDWNSMHPNFYIIFPPKTLAKFPTTFITSFYLTSTQKMLLNNLIQQFPNITIFDVTQIMTQVRGMLQKVSLAVQFVFVFALIAGIIVLFSAIFSTIDARCYENSILRAMGATRKFLRISLLAEFICLGLIAGIVAAIGAEFIGYIMAEKLFSLPFHFNYLIFIFGPLMSIILILSFGLIVTRKVIKVPPSLSLTYH